MKGPVGIVAARVGIVAPYNDLRDSSIRRIVVEDGPDVRRALPVEDNDRGDGFGAGPPRIGHIGMPPQVSWSLPTPTSLLPDRTPSRGRHGSSWATLITHTPGGVAYEIDVAPCHLGSVKVQCPPAAVNRELAGEGAVRQDVADRGGEALGVLSASEQPGLTIAEDFSRTVVAVSGYDWRATRHGLD
jgi:hypothetical protein